MPELSSALEQPSPQPPTARADSWPRRVWRLLKENSLANELYRSMANRGRLSLSSRAPEQLGLTEGAVLFPVFYPIEANEDAPAADLLFLLNLARTSGAKRILEIGTFRARTSYALHLNCPQAALMSYDIQRLPSRFRTSLEAEPGVELRDGPFTGDAGRLRAEPPFDLIFVDGSHLYDDVLADSALAFEIVAPGGCIVWHDYRENNLHTRALRVPEALRSLAVAGREIVHVQGTTCAFFRRPSGQSI
jgi:predicted O-methyltransferase YrrM